MVGVIEDYAASPDGVLAPTTVMVEHLATIDDPDTRRRGSEPMTH